MEAARWGQALASGFLCRLLVKISADRYMRLMRDPENIKNLPFMKMHGLGNDFVVIDSRGRNSVVTPSLARAIGDRHRAAGFDQLAEILDSDSADANLVFYNADGSLSAACGNATRCIARHLLTESGQRSIVLRTERGALACEDAGGGLTRVNMGAPVFDWRQIPLAKDVDTLALPIDGAPVAHGMGNPHCVFIVDDAEAVDLEKLGAEFEHHPIYPERTNVEFVSVTAKNRIRMRIWERGVGVTLASGSGSCASAVAVARRGLTGRAVTVDVDGGTLQIDWREDGVWMTGPTAHVFDGTFTQAFLDSV